MDKQVKLKQKSKRKKMEGRRQHKKRQPQMMHLRRRQSRRRGPRRRQLASSEAASFDNLKHHPSRLSASTRNVEAPSFEIAYFIGSFGIPPTVFHVCGILGGKGVILGDKLDMKRSSYTPP
jgi:hypothetical protein